MGRKAKITIPLLLLAVITVTVLSLFMFTASAEDTTEATLTVATINYGTTEGTDSYGYETSTTQVSSESGSFADMVSALSSLSPEVATRYTLKLNKDVTVDSVFTIVGNENVEIWIDLGGHTITSTVDGPMLVTAGSGATVRFWGEFGADGSRGTFVTAAENGAFAKIAAGSADTLDVNFVDCVFSGAAEDTSLFVADGGKVIFEHSSISHTSGNPVVMFDAENASIALKYSSFAGDKNATLVSSSASKVYIEGGDMIGQYIVVSDDTASSILMTGFECEVNTAFVQGSADTTTYILGASMEIYDAIASGEANADNFVFYYGNGHTYIIGQDPSGYGLGNTDCSYVEEGGCWSMVCSSTQKAVATVATVGSAPATAYYSTPDQALEAELNGVAKDMSAVTDSTVKVVALINDYSSGSSGATAAAFKGCEDASLIFDFNGYSINYTSTKANYLIQVSHDMHATIDGADVSGNRGSFTAAGGYQRIIYARQAAASGQISYHLVSRISNLNFVATGLYHASAASTPIIDVGCGYLYLDNLKLTYTGAIVTDSNKATETCLMIRLGHSSFKRGAAFVNNVTVESTATCGIGVNAFSVTESWRAFVDGYKTVSVLNSLNASGSASTVKLSNSTLHSTDALFSGAGTVNIYDSTLTTDTGVVSTGSVMPTFFYGTGKTVIYTNGNILSGNTTADGEYRIGVVSEGVYKLISESDVHSITMPAVFSSGMMLQRGKQVNVYGYCQEVGATISVTIGDETATAIVDENGEWCASFAPLEAARGVTISIKQVGKGVADIPDVLYEDVNIGEIWVTSGQSNASLFSGYLEDVNEVALLSETLGIREFTSNGYSLLPDAYGNGEWRDVTASVVKRTSSYTMSAVGYATVAKLAAELGPDVPVGLITIAQGSTKISTWIDYEHLEELSPFLADNYDGVVADGALPDKPHGSNAVPTILYNRHVYPLRHFSAAGVLWYQGCGDIPGKYYKSDYIGQSSVPYLGPEGSTYTQFFAALQEVFRGAFDNGGLDMPFYVMQLAPYSRSGDGPANGSYIYEFRLEQYDFCNELDNTYLVSLAVDGMAFTSNDVNGGAFIHPSRKSPVGNRTADMILANEYGIEYADVISYPQPISAVMNADGTVTVTFDTELKLFYGDSVEGFELTADGSTWVKASGTIDGNKLILSASGVSSAVGVRYGFGRTQVELRDGTVIEVAHLTGQYILNETETQYTVTDALTGTEYVINVNSNDAIRTKNHGNITNASGVPLVLFSMDVTAEY